MRHCHGKSYDTHVNISHMCKICANIFLLNSISCLISGEILPISLLKWRVYSFKAIFLHMHFNIPITSSINNGWSQFIWWNSVCQKSNSSTLSDVKAEVKAFIDYIIIRGKSKLHEHLQKQQGGFVQSMAKCFTSSAHWSFLFSLQYWIALSRKGST